MKEVNIYLADDHAILRDGLKYILSTVQCYNIIGEADNGKKALEDIERIKPDIVILDISMPVMTGVEVVHQLKKYVPDVKIVILSKHNNEEYIYQLLEYGIDGYVLKDNAGEDLLKAVNEVLKGNIYLSPKITAKLVIGLRKPARVFRHDSACETKGSLSFREKEVLKLLAEGKSNKETALILRIADKTVRAHRSNIMKKLDIHSSVELVKCAIKLKLIEI